jgi:hypothetical protein
MGFVMTCRCSNACRGVCLFFLVFVALLDTIVAYTGLPLMRCGECSFLYWRYRSTGIVLVSASKAARAVVFHAPVATRRASFCTDSRIVVILSVVPFWPYPGWLLYHAELAYAIFGRMVAL